MPDDIKEEVTEQAEATVEQQDSDFSGGFGEEKTH